MDLEHIKINLSKYKSMTNTVCNVCGRALVLKPGGQRKDGSTYKAFMGCSVWDDEHKKAQEAYKAAKSGYNPSPQAIKTPTDAPSRMTGELFIIDKLDAIQADIKKLLDKFN